MVLHFGTVLGFLANFVLGLWLLYLGPWAYKSTVGIDFWAFLFLVWAFHWWDIRFSLLLSFISKLLSSRGNLLAIHFFLAFRLRLRWDFCLWAFLQFAGGGLHCRGILMTMGSLDSWAFASTAILLHNPEIVFTFFRGCLFPVDVFTCLHFHRFKLSNFWAVTIKCLHFFTINSYVGKINPR